MEPRNIYSDTPVRVTVKGETGVYSLAGPHTLAAWANTLSDLTGYTIEHVRKQMMEGLHTQYGVIIPTAAGDLCPIRFLVTLESAQKPGQSPA